jgi:hypothetical protein
MRQSLNTWFLAPTRATRSARQRARLELEALEKREVLSAPSYVLSNGNLYQKSAAGATLIDRNVQSYQADGHGHVAVLEQTGNLKYYSNPTLTTIDSGVTAYHLGSTGTLFEVDSQGNFQVYTLSAGTALVDANVKSLTFASTGRVYDLRNDGTFLGSDNGLPGDFTQLDTGVESLAVAPGGRVYLLQNDGTLLGSNDGQSGDFTTIDTGVQSFAVTSKGRVFLLQSDGTFLTSSNGQQADFTQLDMNVQSIVLVSTGVIYELETNGQLLSSSTGLVGSFTLAGKAVMSISSSNGTLVVSDWFSQNLNDPGVAAVARKDFALHNALTYTDLLGVFRQADAGTTVSAAELQSLRALVTNAAYLNISAADTDLLSKTVNGDPADSHYGGQTLAALAAGSRSVVLRDLVNKWFLGLDLPTAGGTYSACGGVLFGSAGPLYTDVCQGYLGDCWLIASFAETAARMPSIIKSMFIANGNNTWTVRLYPNGVADYVTVNNELPDGGRLYDNVGGRPLWVGLAEKAFAQENASGQLSTANPGANSYSALNGDDPTVALAAITGLPTNDNYVHATTLATVWEQGQLITLCTTNNPANGAIVPDHCYAVIGYNKSTGAISLFNPWGTGGGYLGSNNHYYAGYVTVSNKALASTFDGIETCGTEVSRKESSTAGAFCSLLNEPAGLTRQGDSDHDTANGHAPVATQSQAIDAVFLALAARQGQGVRLASDLGTGEQATRNDGRGEGEWGIV